MTGFFKGIATAMVTPFNENGVNFGAFKKMMEYQIDGGSDALVVLGTTGEPATMTEEEKTEVIRFAVKEAGGRGAIIGNVLMHLWDDEESLWSLFEEFQSLAE